MENKSKFIEHQIDIRIRFSEVDAMNVVWHGNYLKFFEDGREALGTEYGLHYLDFADKGYFVPIVKSSIEHLATASYGDELRVTTRLYYSRAAKIIHDYEVFNLTTNKISAKGTTMQVFVTLDKELFLTNPDFYEEWKEAQNWKTAE